MKISPRKTAWLRASPTRASSASPAAFLRALGASSLVHLFALWSLTWIGMTQPSAGGRTHDARILFAGLSAPAEELPEREVEPQREVTLPPEVEPEPEPDVELVDLPPREDFPPLYRQRDPFEDLSTTVTLVVPQRAAREPLGRTGAVAAERPVEPVRPAPPVPEATEPEPPDEEVAADEPAPAEDVGDSEPVLRHGPPPAYPTKALRMGWQGVVVCRITISPKGRVTDVEVADSSGYAVLDDAALKAIREWQFEPGTQGGVIAERVILHKVRFRLTS